MAEDTQVKQMIEFIELEAQERVAEIRMKTDAEFESQYQEYKRNLEKKLADEFSAKREQHRTEKLIRTSQQRQKVLYSMLQFRFQKLEELKHDIINKLSNIDKNPNYSKFLVNLIVQGLLRMQEERVTVVCREIDIPIVTKILPEAANLYKQLVEKATGYKPSLEPLKIETKRYLASPYKEGSHADFSLGGVELTARGNTIVCKNTIESRLDIAFQYLKPTIRSELFGSKLKAASQHDSVPKQ
uniref:V-type proton ATPase subunit E n=1 Tax=Lygus hesperus TaxID=30085 RepID=A0A0A9VZZ6_LYGHE